MDTPFQFMMSGGPIPRLFYDYVTDAPIAKCLMCSRDILHDGTVYMIEKAVKGTDVLYEIAVCMACSEGNQQKMSEESAERIQEFFSQNVDMPTRMASLMEKYGGYNTIGWVDECLVSGKKREELAEYTLYGFFRNDQILAGEFPFMISAEVLAEVSGLLSQETKDEMGRLGDENLGVPPEFEDLFRKRTPVLL